MKLIFNLGHPAHVHLFKYTIWNLQSTGYEVKILTRDKRIIKNLLETYGFRYEIISSKGKGLLGIGKELLIQDFELFKFAKKYRPDLMLGVLDPPITHVGRMLRIPSLNFTDTEHAKIANIATLPGSSVILTPTCYLNNLGSKQIRYNGYHELAYLHPNYFTANPVVLSELDLTEDEPFIIVRFVSWEASHDIGQHGIRDKVLLVKELEKYGRVLITSEGELPEELKSYKIRVSPEKLHDLLYYATLYVGEGATTASECAVLGTHAVYVNSLGLGYIGEEDEKYHLVSDFSGRVCTDETVLAEAKMLLENKNLKQESITKRDLLLQGKCDVTAFMIWFIENYPESIYQMKENPEIQKQFGARRN